MKGKELSSLLNINKVEKEYREKMKERLFNQSFSYNEAGQYSFLDTISTIQKRLGDREVINFLNGFESRDFAFFFAPIYEKIAPIDYPIYRILLSIINGLKSKEKTFLSETVRLLWKFLHELRRMMSKKTDLSMEDYYLASLLELFNGIYENNLEDRLPRITEQVDAIVKSKIEIVAYCYYELKKTPHWGEKIYFLGDPNLVEQELKRLLKQDSKTLDTNSKEKGVKKFIVNERIILKLEYGATHIYVNNERFLQCNRLVLNIPVEEFRDYEQINSIDEVADVIKKKTIWKNQIIQGSDAIPDLNQRHDITPIQEFWGHCSNLQMWFEHDYDTRLLHTNLSFPLLKKLTEVGDPKAKNVFKNEIRDRILEGGSNVFMFLKQEGYVQYLAKKDITLIFEEKFFKIFEQQDYTQIRDMIKNPYIFNITNNISDYSGIFLKEFNIFQILHDVWVFFSGKTIGQIKAFGEIGEPNQDTKREISKLKSDFDKLEKKIYSFVRRLISIYKANPKFENSKEFSNGLYSYLEKKLGNSEFENLDYYFLRDLETLNFQGIREILKTKIKNDLINLNSASLFSILRNHYLTYLNINEINHTLKNCKLNNVKIPYLRDSLKILRVLFSEFEYLMKKGDKLTFVIQESKQSIKIVKKDFNPYSLAFLYKNQYLSFNSRADFLKILLSEEEADVIIALEKSFLRNTRIDNYFMLVEGFEDSNPGLSHKMVIENNKIVGITISSGDISIFSELQKFSHLKQMHLNNVKIPELPSSITTFKKLEYIILQNAGLNKFPLSFGDLKNLKSIHIHSNEPLSFPDTIKKLPFLEEIVLTFIKDDFFKSMENHFPEIFTQIKSLKKLIITDSNLSNISKFIGNLKSLEELDLCSNQLSSLPPILTGLTSLKKLNLSFNEIIKLPPFIGNMGSLEHLNIGHNRISFLPDSIGKLKNLKTLNLRGNKLKKLPHSILELPSLESLDVENNKLIISKKMYKELENRGVKIKSLSG